jgi:Wiskott-Aldrich syndrome protein
MNRSLNRSFSVGSPSGNRTPEVADMKAKVQAAKSMYRAQKARYLQEREQARQREKERHRYGTEQIDEFTPFEWSRSLIDVDEEPAPQIVSNAREPSNQPEMINIPGAFPIHPRSGVFHDDALAEEFRIEAIERICRQLGDMGFTESEHPGLAGKVASLLPSKGSITKDIEDGVITNLLEELLPLNPPGAFASGSRSN